MKIKFMLCYVMLCYVTFQLSSEMHCLPFFALSSFVVVVVLFFADFKTEIKDLTFM